MLLDIRYENHLSASSTQVVQLKEKKKDVESPFRLVRMFRDSSRGMGPDSSRGVAVSDVEGNLYYIDLLPHCKSCDGKESAYDDLGIRTLKGLPAKGIGNKRNPNAWEELMDLLGDAPSEKIQQALKSVFKCGPLICKPKDLSLN